MSSGLDRSSALSDKDKDSLNTYVSRSMQKAGVPGLSLTIVRDGKILFSRGYGRRDMEHKKPATENTLYGVGSVTKSFTALAVLQLEEMGLLKTSDPVTKYAKSYGVDEHAGKTTISHLLSHSSGIPSLNVAEIILFRDIGMDTSNIPITNLDDFYQLLNGSRGERHSPPGKKFLYWNEGYTILGKIIEDVSGKSYEQYMTENVLKPLNMRRSSFSKGKVLEDGDHAVPYYRGEDGVNKPSEISDDPMVLAPGGLISSSLELSTYLGLWTGASLRKSTVMSPERLKELIKPRIISSTTGQFGETRYGYGWMSTDNFFGNTLVMHSGSVAASSGFVGFVPALGLGVAIGANNSDAPTSRIGTYALSLLIDGANPEDLPFIKVMKLRDSLKGYYEDYRGYSRVRIGDGPDGLLNMAIESDEYHLNLPLIFEGDEIYTVVDDFKMPLEIRFTDSGKVEIYFERHRFVKK